MRGNVRKSFHSVQWRPPAGLPEGPKIFAANHHGWHDGYLLYVACTAMNVPVVDWIAEFDAFPLFAKVGGMPFPPSDPSRRAATVRKTIRLMKDEGRSLMLFAEGILHRPPELLPFGRSLEVVAAKTGAAVIPTAIRYEIAMHERPEPFLLFGAPVEPGPKLAERSRLAVRRLLDEGATLIRHDEAVFETLVAGTKDVNERMKWPGSKR
ncbi:hypothetical protein EON79_22700 [bacterium]|nr:MAG: hypothetical protein EON79_22700 [bacterium]